MRGATWGKAGFLAVAGQGTLATCNSTDINNGKWHCAALEVPPLPMEEGTGPAAAVDSEPLRAATADENGKITLFELLRDNDHIEWQNLGSVFLPQLFKDDGTDLEVAAISLTSKALLVTARDGGVHQWQLQDGLPT